MIDLKRKEDCCGCGACSQACPAKCIQLAFDDEGFLYPKVTADKCLHCSLCERVCPVVNPDKSRTPLAVYAAKNKDGDVVEKSSSGGIFTALAERIVRSGGVVFGARFDDQWKVVLDCVETEDDLKHIRRSKYVQAYVGDSYIKAKKMLSQGRFVLFSGTPCQISGLRHYLGRDYDNLILLDLICEGVPSPKIWSRYLSEEICGLKKRYLEKEPDSKSGNIVIDDISFRDKTLGWKQFSFSITSHLEFPDGRRADVPKYVNRNSSYLQCMFRYLHLRPICYECPFKSCRSQSDITLGDYWGIDKLHPDIDYKRGISMVYVNTPKGESIFDKSLFELRETSYSEAFKYNNVVSSVKKHPYRNRFFKRASSAPSIIELFDSNLWTRFERIKMGVRNVLGEKLYAKGADLWRRLRK